MKLKVDLVTNLEFNRAVLTVIPTFCLYGYEIYRYNITNWKLAGYGYNARSRVL